jgi:hypothetical protein
LKRSEQRYGGKKETFDVAAKETAIGNGAARGNPPDDLKSAAGEILTVRGKFSSWSAVATIFVLSPDKLRHSYNREASGAARRSNQKDARMERRRNNAGR